MNFIRPACASSVVWNCETKPFEALDLAAIERLARPYQLLGRLCYFEGWLLLIHPHDSYCSESRFERCLSTSPSSSLGTWHEILHIVRLEISKQ